MKTIKTYQCKCGEDFYEDDLHCPNCGNTIDRRKLKKTETPEVVKEVLPEIEIKNIDKFRSKPFVNMANDMVRVQLIMSRNKWHEFKKLIK